MTNPVIKPAAKGAHRGHIAGLDGLRALAVLLVIIYHYAPGVLKGGFLGVDMFFVISGFIITTILVRQYQQRRGIDITNFWVRRMRRLYPAVLALVVVCATLTLIFAHDLLFGIRRQIAGALTFTTNWTELLLGNSYFQRTTPVVFANLWSLGIEMQFYLIWPFLLLLMLRKVNKWYWNAAIALGIALASAIAMGVIFNPAADPTRVYYGLDTHSFGLMFGAALALVWTAQHDNPFARGNARIAGPALTIVGLIGLFTLAALMGRHNNLTFRGGLAFAALLAAATIAGLLMMPTFSEKFVDNVALRWIGQRSYGLYLWHWPLLLIVSDAWRVSVGTYQYWAQRGLALALAVGAAALSYRYIETPIRRNGLRASLATLKSSDARLRTPVTAAAAVLVLGAAFAVALAPKQSALAAQRQAAEGLIVSSGQQDVSDQVHQAQQAISATPETTEATKTAEPTPLTPPKPTPNVDEATKRAAREGKLPDPAKADGNNLTVIGDSLPETAQFTIKRTFPGVYVNAAMNRRWSHAMKMIKDAEANGGLRRTVVLDFGTNGGLPDHGVLDKVLDYLGPKRQIILVDNYSLEDFEGDVNQGLAAAARARPNVEVARWREVASTHREILGGDGIHPNVAGEKAFAKVIDEALDRLSQKLQAAYDSK